MPEWPVWCPRALSNRHARANVKLNRMRMTRLPYHRHLSIATLVAALLTAGCGKDDAGAPSGGNGSTPKGANPAGGDGTGRISGGEIMIINDVIIKTGEQTPYTGLVVWSHENGDPQMESRCEAGRWNGPSKWWYEDGTLAGEGTYKEGKWEGEYKEWHENGKLKVQVTFKEGKEDGREIWKYENGQTQSITTYQAGLKEGEAKGFFESGKPSWEAIWRSNVPHGEYWEWYENGQKKSVIRYDLGKRAGKEEHWYDTPGAQQQKAWEVTWVDNKKNGVYQEWYPSGIPMKWTTFVNGVLHGESGSRYESGQMARRQTFQNGKEVSRMEWDVNGQVTANGVVQLPQGRTHKWTTANIVQHCTGKSGNEIVAIFGQADASGAGGAWVYKGINFINPQTSQQFKGSVAFTFQGNRVTQVQTVATP